MQGKSRIIEFSLCNSREWEASTKLSPVLCYLYSYHLHCKSKDLNFCSFDVKFQSGSTKLDDLFRSDRAVSLFL